MADYEEVTGANVASPEDFVRSLAAALSEFSAANNARGAAQPVAPAVLAKRREARQRLDELLSEYEEKGIVPRYEIGGPSPGGFFVDDILIEVGQLIDFPGIPNEQMEPRNEPARHVMTLFLESIGGVTPDLGEQSYDAYRNRPRHAAVVGSRSEPPPLGTPRATSRAVIVDPDGNPTDAAPPEIPGVNSAQASILHPHRNQRRNGRYPSMSETLA